MMVSDLQPYIPEHSRAYILSWFKKNPVHLRISKARSSKFGDYRTPLKNFPARISVNHNLNRFDFLITLVHEMAHHEVWKESTAPVSFFRVSRKKVRPRPHGREWKQHFRQLMGPMMNNTVFPEDVLHQLIAHFENPRSASKLNERLFVALKGYDVPDGTVFIETLAFGAEFSLPAGRRFLKQEKLRKRYRCVCLNNGRTYLFSPLARVLPVSS